jgi:type II secretion system protein N
MIDKKILIRRASFVAYFVLVFLIFLLLLFPVDRIKTKLESEIRRRTPLELNVSHISPLFFDRFVMHDVVVSDRSGNVLFESRSVNTSMSFFSLLRDLLSLDMKAKAYGGELLVKIQQGPGRQYLQVDASNLDIGSYSLLKNAGFRVTGKLGGNFEMTGDIGKGRLWLKGLAWRELKVKGFSVPDLDIDQCWLEADIKGDRMTIKKLELDGKELKVRCLGDVVLRERGSLNLTIRFKLSERLEREKNDSLALLLALAKNKDAEGFHLLNLGGTLDAPVPRP